MARRSADAVQTPNAILIQRYLPWINGAALAGSAVFSYPSREYVLVGLMLFLPLLDRGWRLPALPRFRAHYLTWGGLLLAGVMLLAWRPSSALFALATLLTAAIPEEWFFRAYFMTRNGPGWRANLATSALFSLLHGLTQGWRPCWYSCPRCFTAGCTSARATEKPGQRAIFSNILKFRDRSQEREIGVRDGFSDAAYTNISFGENPSLTPIS